MEQNRADSVYAYRRERQYNTVAGYQERRGKAYAGKEYLGKFGKRFIDLVNVANSLTFVAGFFLGRAVLLGELYPFGAAFVAVIFWHLRPQGPFAVAGVLGGVLSIAGGEIPVGLISCVFLSGLGASFLPSNSGRPWLVLPGMVVAVIMAVRSSFLAFIDAIPYEYVSVAFEAVFAAIFTLLAMRAIPSLLVIRSPEALKNEEIFCIMALAGGIVAGTGDIAWGLFSLRSTMIYFLVLLAALAGGTGAGSATGAVMGFIPGLAYTHFPLIVGTYAFSGLLAGLFRSFGKPGVAVGFLLSNVILSMYTSDFSQLTAAVAQTAVAALLIFCIPRKWLGELTTSLVPVVEGYSENDGPEVRVRELIAERMGRWSGVCKEIAKTFEQAAATSFPAGEEKNLQDLFGEVGKKVCKGCSHYGTCWDREFYKTYQNLLNLFTIADNYGRVTLDDLDEETASKCNRAKELVITITCLYEMYKLNHFWSKRLVESNSLVSEQLKGIGNVIENLSGELESQEFCRQEAKTIKHKLKKMGFRVVSLEIYQAGEEKPEVHVTMPACGRRMICRYEVGPFLSKEMGCSMSVATVSCPYAEDEEFCNFRVYPNPRYQISLGVAAVGKDGSAISGDSFLSLPLAGGKFAVLLSDGMGSGESASIESTTTLGLIAKLLDSGFGRDLSIKTVNSILLLRSPEESFATVDMTAVDIYTAEAEFAKIGACPGFVVRGQQVGTVRANSLPVGIVDEVEVFSVSKQLNHGDMVIMVTDGVLDSDKKMGDQEEWLVEVLREISGLKPQEVAELIINLAQTGARRDDMTAVALRIEKVKS